MIIMRKDDGIWIEVQSESGKHGLLNLNSLNGMVREAFMEWAEGRLGGFDEIRIGEIKPEEMRERYKTEMTEEGKRELLFNKRLGFGKYALTKWKDVTDEHLAFLVSDDCRTTDERKKNAQFEIDRRKRR